MKYKRTVITAGLIAVAIISGAGGCAPEGKHEPDPMAESLKPLKGKEFEVMFLKDMIHHHQSAVEMAELVASHTKRPELNQLAKNIVTAQKAEIDQMTGWLTSWHGETPGSMAQMPGMDEMMKGMEALKAAKDAEFDKMFINMMSEHHKRALMMAKLVGDRTDRAELKQLANQIIKEQTKEIEQMAGWEKAWFKP